MSVAWPAIDEHPPGIDRAYWRSTMTRANAIVTGVLGVVMGGALALGSVREYLHVASWVPAVLVATWPITVALTRRLNEQALREASPALVWFFVHGVVTGGSIGAASSHTFSAAWALLLVFPMSWAFTFPLNRALLVAFAVIPPLERAVLAPAVDVRTIAYPAVLGLFAAASFGVMSLRRLRFRALEEARLRGQSFGARDPADAAALLAAMRVHDGLSGALMLASTRAAAGSDAEAMEAARVFVRKARTTLAGFTAGADRDLRDWLGQLGRDFGLELEVVVTGESGPPSPDESDILVELLGNQARHGRPGAIRLAVSRRRSGTRIEMQAPGDSPVPGEGRGTRNLVRRVRAFGGTVVFASDASGANTVVTLPHGLGPGVIATLVHATPPIVVFVWSGDVIVASAFGALAVLLIAVATRGNAIAIGDHARRHGALRLEIDRAAMPTLIEVRGELSAWLVALEAATTGAEARAELERMSRRMQALLASLETTVSSAGLDAAPPAPLAAGS